MLFLEKALHMTVVCGLLSCSDNCTVSRDHIVNVTMPFGLIMHEFYLGIICL